MINVENSSLAQNPNPKTQIHNSKLQNTCDESSYAPLNELAIIDIYIIVYLYSYIEITTEAHSLNHPLRARNNFRKIILRAIFKYIYLMSTYIIYNMS